MPSLRRLATFCAVLTMIGGNLAAAARDNTTFQPLNQPATKESHPGKFVWADLFTTDPEAATKFYSGLFGWTANKINQDGNTYTVFSNGSRPVAGLAPRPASNTKRASRWVGYIAVANLGATLKLVTKAGGQIRAPAGDFPRRGFQAIIADNEGSTIGLLQSTSGDSADTEAKPGDWQWFELYVKSPKDVSAFYGKVLKYDVTADTRTERKNDFLLSSGRHERAGVAPLPENDDAKPGWLGVVRVADIDASLAQVTKLGGEVLLAPRPAAFESRFAIIADTTGGTIGLVQYVDATNPANRP